MLNSSEKQSEKKNIPLEGVSVDDLRHIGLLSLLNEYSGLCDSEMWLEIMKLASAASHSGNISGRRAYELLAILCSFRMSSDDPANTWHPRWQDDKEKMLTPSELHKEQNLALAEIILDIGHPALRGRIADVVWSNDRSQFKAGKEAINAYCEIINEHINRMENNNSPNYTFIFELVNLLQRALFINAVISKRGHIPDCLNNSFEKFYAFSAKKFLYVVFQKIGEIAIWYKIKKYQTVALDGEDLVTKGNNKDYPEARKKVWYLAATCYEKTNDDIGRRRCLEQYSKETLRMREHVSSYAAKASWIRQAIIELQAAGGFQSWIEELIPEMRIMQQLSVGEMSTTSSNLDISIEYEEIQKIFDGLDLPDTLFKFAFISASPSIKDLNKYILENRPSGLNSIFPDNIFLDREGKPFAKTSSSFKDGIPNNEWFRENSLSPMSTLRVQVVEAAIKPIRRSMMLRFPIEIRHFNAIVNLSYFVPYGHEHIFSLGFARFWQGDFTSAAYILIPQLENTLRHILFCNGRDSFKFNNGEFQEDRSLSGLLDNRRDDLVYILGEETVNEIDLLFHFHAGPALRHKVAHGKLTAGDCYSTDSVYACWFIYRLICLPILQSWKEQVAPQIELTL